MEMSEQAQRIFRGPYSGCVSNVPVLSSRYVAIRRDGAKIVALWSVDYWRKVKPKKGKR